MHPFFITVLEGISVYKALYRKWRPTTFDEVCGQERVTDVLRYETENGRISHAYLFCGSRGTGKTSCAKILAKAVNCENPKNGNPCNECESCRSIESQISTDVVEMDAASNTGVDNVRNIKEEIVFTPASLKYRVYIIDEVHMMSTSAFNALLKTLEEPPGHVIFILATTELHKLPATIISRCQRFDFRRLSMSAIVGRLHVIADAEGIQLTDDGAKAIARSVQGGMRDAISMLELCAGHGGIVDEEKVVSIVGSGGRDTIESLVDAILDRNYDGIFGCISDVFMSSRDLTVFWQEIIDYYRDMLVVKTTADPADYLDLTEGELARLRARADRFSKTQLLYQSRVLSDTYVDMSRAVSLRRSRAEVGLVKMCDPELSDNSESLLSRIAKLEEAILSGVAASPRTTTESQPKNTAESVPTAPPVSSPASEASAPARSELKPEATKPSRREISCWKEAVEKVGKVKAGIFGFLDNSRCYLLGDGSIAIEVGSDFARRMIERGNTLDLVRNALCGLENIAPNAAVRVVTAASVASDDPASELERALNNQK